eukprot:GGOE01028234.1.p1 GENE.GGOE01028234.1~~GGOE01028234.1.p1  ORF type:complete len:286 (-),score=7.45 GGOE01028234.1:249-1106(-)
MPVDWHWFARQPQRTLPLRPSRPLCLLSPGCRSLVPPHVRPYLNAVRCRAPRCGGWPPASQAALWLCCGTPSPQLNIKPPAAGNAICLASSPSRQDALLLTRTPQPPLSPSQPPTRCKSPASGQVIDSLCTCPQPSPRLHPVALPANPPSIVEVHCVRHTAASVGRNTSVGGSFCVYLSLIQYQSAKGQTPNGKKIHPHDNSPKAPGSAPWGLPPSPLYGWPVSCIADKWPLLAPPLSRCRTALLTHPTHPMAVAPTVPCPLILHTSHQARKGLVHWPDPFAPLP